MPFRIAISGLNATQAGLRTTANNIANAGTTGFRQSRAEFTDLFSADPFGSNTIGSGVRVARIAQQHSQGNIQFTDNALDAAISGQGFFVVSDGGSQLYTRSGDFGVDADGFVVNSEGHRLQAYPVGNNGRFNTSAPTDLRMSVGRVTGVTVDANGVVTARYSNGQSTTIGKVAIANFPNPQGLQPVGGTAWAESAASGNPAIGEAGTGSLGLIQSGALETSNTDLTGQLLNMIEFSRQIEMQAKVIKTASENADAASSMLDRRDS